MTQDGEYRSKLIRLLNDQARRVGGVEYLLALGA